MRKYVFAIATLATVVAAAPVFAQNVGSPAGDRSIGGQRGTSDPGTSGGEDSSTYLTGPSRYRSEADQGATTYYGMGTSYYYGTTRRERAEIRVQCAADYRLRGSDLCASVGM